MKERRKRREKKKRFYPKAKRNEEQEKKIQIRTSIGGVHILTEIKGKIVYLL